MPGSSSPAVGSSATVLIFSIFLSFLITIAGYVVSDKSNSPTISSAVFGMIYTIISLSIYWTARSVANSPTFFDMSPVMNAIVLSIMSVIFIFFQAAIPVYYFQKKKSMPWLIGFFISAVVSIVCLLWVGGESDILSMYIFVVGPFVIVLTLIPVYISRNFDIPRVGSSKF